MGTENRKKSHPTKNEFEIFRPMSARRSGKGTDSDTAIRGETVIWAGNAVEISSDLRAGRMGGTSKRGIFGRISQVITVHAPLPPNRSIATHGRCIIDFIGRKWVLISVHRFQIACWTIRTVITQL